MAVDRPKGTREGTPEWTLEPMSVERTKRTEPEEEGPTAQRRGRALKERPKSRRTRAADSFCGAPTPREDPEDPPGDGRRSRGER